MIKTGDDYRASLRDGSLDIERKTGDILDKVIADKREET